MRLCMEELAVQVPIVKEVLDAMNIPRYELEGWEADDLTANFFTTLGFAGVSGACMISGMAE